MAYSNDKEEILRKKASIEKLETDLYIDNIQSHPLYSDKHNDILPFNKKIVEMSEDYKDLMFNLSKHSVKTKSGELVEIGSESIMVIKQMSAEEIIDYSKRMHNSLK